MLNQQVTLLNHAGGKALTAAKTPIARGTVSLPLPSDSVLAEATSPIAAASTGSGNRSASTCQGVRPSQRFLLAAVLLPALAAFPHCAVGQMLVRKECGRCGEAVGLDACVGQTCPHCHATWGSQQDQYRSGGGAGAFPGGVSPPPVVIDPEFRRRQEWQSRLETRDAIFRKWAEQRHEMLETNRDEARLAAERFRQTDDPVARGWRYLASGKLCEAEGDVRAAAAYHKLAARYIPPRVTTLATAADSL